MSEKEELVFVPLGGAGEIGMNLYLYGFGKGDDKKWLIVDMGVSFAGPAEPGINLIFPDISFLEERRDQIVGAIITHAHEDHIGAVAHLWPRLEMPVFASPFASMMLKGKLLEHDLYENVPVNEIAPGREFELSPFQIEPFQVTHSIPESMGFIIKTGGKTIVHTGDWRLDDTPVLQGKMDLDRLGELGRKGCDFLVCDSTNVLSDKRSLSEKQVAENLHEVIEKAPGRVVVTSFASNIGRMSSLMEIAKKTDRHVIISGRALERSILLSRELGILKDMPDLVPVEEFDNLPRDKVMLLCTGSQGEARAQCARIASKEHTHVELDEGDWVIFSSKTIPGNERDVLRVINKFAKEGIHVITADREKIHETGHPRQEELSQLYNVLKPDCLVPMHGEARHLYAHARFAMEQGIKKFVTAFNGEMIRLSPGEPEKIADITAGRLYEDGFLITDSETGPLKARRKLSYVGSVAVSLVVNARGDLISGPQIICDGVPDVDAAGSAFEDVLREGALAGIDSLPRKRRARADELSEVVRAAVRRRARQVWGKKPQTHVFVHVV